MRNLGNKLKRIRVLDSHQYTIALVFADGLRGEVDLSPIFASPRGLAAEILKGGMFNQCFVEWGALAWPNGFELCPDMLRLLAKSQQKKIAA